MFWENLALACAGSTLDAVFGMGGISEADLQSALEDAVKDVDTNTRRAILADRLNTLAANIFALQQLLRDYTHNGDQEGEHNPLLNAIAAHGHRAKLPLRVVVVDQPAAVR